MTAMISINNEIRNSDAKAGNTVPGNPRINIITPILEMV